MFEVLGMTHSNVPRRGSSYPFSIGPETMEESEEFETKPSHKSDADRTASSSGAEAQCFQFAECRSSLCYGRDEFSSDPLRRMTFSAACSTQSRCKLFLPSRNFSISPRDRPLAPEQNHAFGQAHPSPMGRARPRSARERSPSRHRETSRLSRRCLHARAGLRPHGARAICRNYYHSQREQVRRPRPPFDPRHPIPKGGCHQSSNR